jgi:two-component system, chemotaxis family, protein-glutamate methylesterase/glutaminase
MWEIDEGDMVRYRCHVGHTYTAEVMSLVLDESLRRALATAQRALEERVALARKLYKQAKESGHSLMAENWAGKMREFERDMDVIRSSVRRMNRAAEDHERVKSAAG